MCVRFRCVRGKLLTQRATVPPTIPRVFCAHLVPSGSPYIESWYVRLNENARVGGKCIDRTLYENVDSVKIKVRFYTTDIDILRVASMHRIVFYILQTLLSKATYNWGIHKAINLEEANRQRKCP